MPGEYRYFTQHVRYMLWINKNTKQAGVRTSVYARPMVGRCGRTRTCNAQIKPVCIACVCVCVYVPKTSSRSRIIEIDLFLRHRHHRRLPVDPIPSDPSNRPPIPWTGSFAYCVIMARLKMWESSKNRFVSVKECFKGRKSFVVCDALPLWP